MTGTATEFWQGEFGTEYTERNAHTKIGGMRANINLFANLMGKMPGIETLVEFGCGDGKNLRAIHAINPNIYLHGCDINAEALKKVPSYVTTEVLDATKIAAPVVFDVVLTKGFCIHVPPDSIESVYDTIVGAASRYLLIAEYFNPTPVMIPYRGENDRMWKRDFAGEILDRHPSLQLIDYGWVYNRDQFPQDNLTWFLMEKQP